MADWKARQYVPDSDEEDEDSLKDEQTIVVKSPDTQQLKELLLSEESRSIQVEDASASLEQLEDSPNEDYEDEEFRNIDAVLEEQAGNQARLDQYPSSLLLGEQPQDVSTQVDGPTVSALSSILSSVAGSPLSLSPRTRAPSTPHEPPRLSLDDASARLEEAPANPSGRRFRQRKANQLNPYTIEGLQYKQTWKSRGLVPLQVKNPTQKETENGDDGSESDFEEESQAVDAERNDLTRIDDENASDDASQLELFDLDGEDFPDLQPTLRPPLDNAIVQGSKRRKTGHTYSAKDRRQKLNRNPRTTFPVRADGWIEVPRAGEPIPPPPRAKSSPIKSDQKASATAKTRDKSVTTLSPTTTYPFDVPSSPVSAPGDFGSLINGGDEIAATPQQLQTPVASSDTWRHRINSATTTPYRRLVRPAVVVIESDSEPISSAEDSVDEDIIRQELVRAQKRTRGVLPASWHKLQLDQMLAQGSQVMQKSTQAAKRQRQNTASPVKEHRLGLARPITGKRHRSSGVANDNAILLESEGDTDAEEDHIAMNRPMPVQQPIDDYMTTNDYPMVYEDDDESDMEDNRIDQMTAGGQRLRKRRRTSNTATKTRQPKIRDVLSREHIGKAHSTTHNLLNSKPQFTRPRKQKARSRSARPRQTRLGILDVTSNLDRGQTPNFVALANRTARKRKDQGRGSPTHKYIHLQNQEETNDARQPLQAWRAGTLATKPRRDKRTVQRQPLQERSANIPQSQFFLHDFDDDGSKDHPAAKFAARQAANTDQQLVPRTQSKIVAGVVHQNRISTRRNHPVISALRSITSTAPAQLEYEKARDPRAAYRPDNPLLLDRFLNGDDTHILRLPAKPSIHRQSQPRKKTPRRLFSPPPIILDDQSKLDNDQRDADRLLTRSSTSEQASSSFFGLLPDGNEYSVTFGIDRLPDGLHFSSASLLGSGLFKQSLTTINDHGTLGPLHTTIDESDVVWDGWDEAVAQQIFQLCDKFVDRASTPQNDAATQTEILTTIQPAIRYLARHIRFLDPIDRRDFVVVWTHRLHKYNDILQEALSNQDDSFKGSITLAEVACHILVLGNQVKQIGDHESIERPAKQAIQVVSGQLLRRALTATFQKGAENFRSFSLQATHLSDHLARSDSARRTETFVVVTHLLPELVSNGSGVWDVMQDFADLLPPTDAKVSELDKIWKRMCTLLPLLEIDSSGRIGKNLPRHGALQNWRLVKRLLQPSFEAYQMGPQPTMNHYIRALYARCWRLLDYWGWYDCESILGSLFDFFARNELRDLRLEYSNGSPKCLDNLSSTTDLALQTLDPCFHILLKLIGKGLRVMRARYTDKKIASIVLRLTPNHGRNLPKDEAIRHEDLNAVRNHFDLLIILYWAAPPTHRVRVGVISRLIDIESSHKEACQLVIHTWSRLVSFQLSTQESSQRLRPFIEWFGEIISKAIRLHKLARIEVEADVRHAKITYGKSFSETHQEETILESQRYVEAILFDALAVAENAITKTDNGILNLGEMLSTSLINILELFDAQKPRTTRLVMGLLGVFRSWIRCAKCVDDGEDSQGFGGSDLANLESGLPTPSTLTLPSLVIQRLQDFISTQFGSDAVVEDVLLKELIDFWLESTELEVRAGNASWSDLLDPYGTGSWLVLRDTAQKRRFTPYFLAALLRSNGNVYDQNKAAFLHEFAGCLVERQSQIKYQHELTSALLNQDSQEPLFQNLPFSKEDDRYNIGLADFTERRIALLSSLIINMRESLSEMRYWNLPGYQQQEQLWIDTLRHLIQTLKINYQSSGDSPEMPGEYTELTQKVIEILQEHASDIVKVDSFFFDAASFPQRARDPEYLTEQIKQLAKRIDEERGQKVLAAFLQSMCERAVVEDKQEHFAEVLKLAMEDNFESSHGHQMKLRTFICCEVVPTYMEYISRSSCGWVLARTIFLALPPMFQTLSRHMNPFDQSGMGSVQHLASSVLSIMSQSIVSLLGQDTQLETRTVVTLVEYFQIAESTINTLDHLWRQNPQAHRQSEELVLYFVHLASYLLRVLDGAGYQQAPDIPGSLGTVEGFNTTQFQAGRIMLQDVLHKALSTNSPQCKWRYENDKVLVYRNFKWDTLPISFGNKDQLKQDLAVTIQHFLGKIAITPAFTGMINEVGLSHTQLEMGAMQGGQEIQAGVMDGFHLY